MIIKCFRCGREIDTPDSSNADYVIADDMIAREPRETLIALKNNQATLIKAANIIEQWRSEEMQNIKEAQLSPDVPPEDKPSDLAPDAKPTEDFVRSQFVDSEYDAVEVPNVATAMKDFGEDFVKAVVEMRSKNIQKTGIICPDCFRDTDFVIWGVHKK